MRQKYIGRRIKTSSIRKNNRAGTAQINACGDSRLRGQRSRKPIGFRLWVVHLISYENVGSTLVTIMVKGDVAAVTSAVEEGARAAAKIGKVTAQNVMPRPIPAVGDIVSVHDIDA